MEKAHYTIDLPNYVTLGSYQILLDFFSPIPSALDTVVKELDTASNLSSLKKDNTQSYLE